MVFEDSYSLFLEYQYYTIKARGAKTGREAEQFCLDNTDDSQLTERERLIFILPVIKWEIENNQLTPPLKDELEIYYRDVSQGKFDNLLGDDEIDLVKKDLFDCYHKIFN